jgi:hypothetical protein
MVLNACLYSMATSPCLQSSTDHGVHAQKGKYGNGNKMTLAPRRRRQGMSSSILTHAHPDTSSPVFVRLNGVAAPVYLHEL